MKTYVRINIVVSTGESAFDGTAQVYEVVETTAPHDKVAEHVRDAIARTMKEVSLEIRSTSAAPLTPPHKNGGAPP